MPPPDLLVSSAPARPGHRRLPGRPSSLRAATVGSSALWMGGDHLLQVNRRYYTESYKRFAFADIQALLLRETPRGLVYSFALAILAAGFGLLGYTTEDPGGRGVLFGIGGFWVGLLLINLVRGDTCVCHLQTAAGPHALPSLSRQRPARRTLRLITEKIEAAQGALVPADAARQMDERTR